MYRQSKFKYWKSKKPREGQSYAKSCYCLSDHFHRSMLEGRVCDELRLRKIAGDIKDYRIEVTYRLELEGCKLGTYRADFVVENPDGTTEIIDAKGIQFPLFKQKWRIMESMFRNDPNTVLRIVTK